MVAVGADDVAPLLTGPSYEAAGRGPCELIMTVHLPAEHRGG